MKASDQTSRCFQCRDRRQHWTAVLAVWLCLILVAKADAQDASLKLFSEDSSSPEEAEVFHAAASRRLIHFMRLNPAVMLLLGASSTTPPFRLALNLRTNAEFEVVLGRRETPGAGRSVWHGTVQGRPGSQVTLALSGGALAGSVFVPGHGMFQIQHAGIGWQRVVEVDVSRAPRCGVEQSSRATINVPVSGDSIFQAASEPPATNAIIDLLIVYTAAARDGAGGIDGMNALIDAAVAEANLAFENSQVNARLSLVHRAEVDYRESGEISEDLDRLEDDDERGPLYGVRQLRGQYRADLVCLITETTGGPFGLANQMREVEVEFGKKAFSVIKREFAISYQALAHELGHNMGCQHDRSTSPIGGAFDFSHAHRFEVDGTLYHTVMAYQPGLPVPHFSNPNVTFLGVPTGVTESETNSANNARTINLSAATVARFDSVMPRGTPPQVALITPTNGAVLFVPTVVELSVEASDADGRVVEVEFYVNGTQVGRRFSPPYRMLWTNSTPGTFTLLAEARDDAGWEVDSRKSRVTMVHPPPSIDPMNCRFVADGVFSLRLRGTDGQAFQLDASTNLTSWVPLMTESFSGETFDFMDAQATNSPARFYRVMPVP